MTRRLALLIAAGLLAGPALAEQSTVRGAVEAASLHDGPLDVVAHYEPAPRGAFEITATFAPREVTMMSAAPLRIVMALGDGDDLAFTIPGYPESVYRFSRVGAAVTVSVRAVASVADAASPRNVASGSQPGSPRRRP